MNPFPNMRFNALAPVLALAALAAQAQSTEPAVPPAGDPGQGASALIGTVDGDTYVSPTGTFRVPIPVLSALGGAITDTTNVVTFQDEFNTHISIAAFPQDATQRWQLSVLGTKDYLQNFLTSFVLPDFARSFPKIQLEKSGRFVPDFDGALIAYTLIPAAPCLRAGFLTWQTMTSRLSPSGATCFLSRTAPSSSSAPSLRSV